MKNKINLMGINLIIILTLLFSAEVVSRFFLNLRIIKPLFNDQDFRIRGRPFVNRDKSKGFALKRNFRNAIYSVNSDGFRGKEFPLDLKNKDVILTLGESTTFGWGVDNQSTYPSFLNTSFKEKNIYVVNGGVPSYSSTQTLLYLKEIIKKKVITPKLILINLAWNDVWYSSIKNWHPNILLHQKAPEWLSLLTKHSRLFHFLVMGHRETVIKNIFNEKALVLYGKNLEEIISFCQNHKIKIALVQPPIDASHMNDKDFLSGLDEFQILYTKSFLLETFKRYIRKMQLVSKKTNVILINHRLDSRFLDQGNFFLDLAHPTAEGNAMMADDIYNQIVNYKLVDSY